MLLKFKIKTSNFKNFVNWLLIQDYKLFAITTYDYINVKEFVKKHLFKSMEHDENDKKRKTFSIDTNHFASISKIISQLPLHDYPYIISLWNNIVYQVVRVISSVQIKYIK